MDVWGLFMVYLRGCLGTILWLVWDGFMVYLRGFLGRFYSSFRGYKVGYFVGILYVTFGLKD